MLHIEIQHLVVLLGVYYFIYKISVYHIHENGWTKVHDGLDVVELHYKYAKEKGLVGDGDVAK